MSPRQKAVGYVVFLIVLAAIGTMLVFVGGPIVHRLHELDSTARTNEHTNVTVFHDDERRVTCWIGGGGISCLRDERPR